LSRRCMTAFVGRSALRATARVPHFQVPSGHGSARRGFAPDARRCAKKGVTQELHMLHRLVLAALLCATAGPLCAFFEQPAGYTRTEQVQTSGTGGPVWDPATGAADFYAQHDGGLRRYDTLGGAFSTTLTFATPPGRFFDSLAIDPTSPDDFYASYSSGTNSGIYKLQRTGPDTAIQTTFVDYAAPD